MPDFKSCFVCSACCYCCPNFELEELDEPRIECSKCHYNSFLCEDCLFQNTKECSQYYNKE